MPTNYTANKANTQAPSPPPSPGVAPILALPADGDPPNASTFAQAYKVLADFIHWLMKPQARSGEWGENFFEFRSAKNHKMFALDHHGMPAGNAFTQVVDFPANFSMKVSTLIGGEAPYFFGIGSPRHQETEPINSNGGTLPGWFYLILNTVVGDSTYRVKSAAPYDVTADVGPRILPYGNAVRLVAGPVSGNRAAISRISSFAFHENVIGSLEWSLEAISGADGSAMICGLVDRFAGSTAEGLLSVAQGIYFRYDALLSPNWLAVAHGPGGPSDITFEDTGIAAALGSGHRFRVVTVGSAADDTSAQRALFFIDDVLVFNITTTLPAAQAAMPFWGIENVAGVSPGMMSVCGPIDPDRQHRTEGMRPEA